ncbi:MAG: retropepsin-like aspartic protease [Asticcacaulis sp.]
MTVEVMVNGKGPFHFVVDTGSEQTAIADNVATALGLELGDIVQVDGIARRIAVKTVTVAEFAFGPFRHRNLRLPVLPREFLFADGYLGLDVIDGSRVTFDFPSPRTAHRAPPLRHGRAGTHGDVTKVQVYGASGRLRAGDCYVDNVQASAFVDSRPRFRSAIRPCRRRF